MKTSSKDQLTAQLQSPSMGQPESEQIIRNGVRGRSFLKGLGVTGAALFPADALLVNDANAQAGTATDDDDGGRLTSGDASILRFLAAAEISESDFWEQYWELGNGTLDFAAINPSGEPLNTTNGNAAYITALQLLDMDMPQYILDNTDDEFSHANFLPGYLNSKGADRLPGRFQCQAQRLYDVRFPCRGH